MVRRLWAIALLVVAIVTALTVPNLAGQRVPGQSTALPISAPPEIGDCVLSAEAPPKRRRNAAEAPVAAAGADAVRGTSRIVPCSGPHRGEIISLAADVADVAGFPSRQIGGADIPDIAACADAAYPVPRLRPLTQAGLRSDLVDPGGRQPWGPSSSRARTRCNGGSVSNGLRVSCSVPRES